MQVSPQKVLQWENQNQFLQERHSSRPEPHKEIILVAVRPNNEGFKLLSWAINTAARPGDTVIAFHLQGNDTKDRSRSARHFALEHEANVCQFNILQDVCNAKQVGLNVRFAVSANQKAELMEECASVGATMLVLSPKKHHRFLKLQMKARELVRRAPSGCSVIMVKDDKVIFHKDPSVKDAQNSSTGSQELVNGYFIRKHPIGNLQRQFSCASSFWSQGSCDLDAVLAADNKIWPFNSEEMSPGGVLDDIRSSSSELDVSLPLSYRHVSRFASKKGLLAYVLQNGKSDCCNTTLKQGTMHRSSMFPPASRLKNFSGPLDYSSMRSSVKSNITSMWSMDNVSHEYDLLSANHRNWTCFSHQELASATDNFSADNVVGRGGHSKVYKGRLSSGRLVAIKRLITSDSDETRCDFLTELGIIGHVSHTNATPLVGFCVEKGLHLIFDFSLHGSLAELLHGVDVPVLEWSLRYKIAVGTAAGLHYLHTGCPKRIIHRDIKASNILLGPDYEPQISDFGLAKWLPKHVDQLVVSPVEGTFGYLAPEYFTHGIVHEKIDVFAFGVLLLELITGRKPIDDAQQSLVIWAKPLLDSKMIEDLVDPRLAGVYDSQEMQTLVLVASLCIQPSDVSRPGMGQVLEMLSSGYVVPETMDPYNLYESEYGRSNYLSDLSRHREIALQF